MTHHTDLSKVAPPALIKSLDFKAIWHNAMLAYQELNPDFKEPLVSSPVVKLIDLMAAERLRIEQRINEAAKAVMLPCAIGSDLDNLAVPFGVERRLIKQGNKDKYPPTEDVFESDEAFRQRIILSAQGSSVAGPVASYIFQTKSVSPMVRDVSVSSPSPGVVKVTVLSNENEPGYLSNKLKEDIKQWLNNKTIRPITDKVEVEAAEIIPYTIKAHLQISPGPDAVSVLDNVKKTLDCYVKDHHMLGKTIYYSGLCAVLHQPGVEVVSILEPQDSVFIGEHQAGFCKNSELVC